MNRTPLILSLLGIIIAVSLYVSRAQYGSQQKKTPTKLQVETSMYPLHYFATHIAGDKADIHIITPPGAEPHEYEPSPREMVRIEKSNMLILNGGIERWGNKVRENLKKTAVTIVTAGEGLLTQSDPHIWLDPIRAKQEAHAIEQGFERIDPANRFFYQKNEKNLDDLLDQLDAAYTEGLAHCDETDIITSHAAFGYLATRYNLKQIPITGLSPDAEPSAQQLVEVTKFAKTQEVKYIFFERFVSPKFAQTVATEMGAGTLVLDPIEGITPDDMTVGKNYRTIMLDNLKNLQLALRCKP